jgi:hypothetical protein
VKHDMKKNLKLTLMLVALSIVVLLVIFWTIEYPIRILNSHPRDEFMGLRPSHPTPGDIELFYTVKTVISSINVMLLIFLLIGYIDIYRKTKSEFTIGLLIFSMTLLLYALSSNPLIHWLFGFRAFGLGPFAMLPDLFACVALSILLYFTIKY